MKNRILFLAIVVIVDLELSADDLRCEFEAPSPCASGIGALIGIKP